MWDVFISHASEDKENLVRALAKQLKEVYRVSVWYDEFSLEYGDSLIKSIQKGLQDSKFGVVVLSDYFFKKQWTENERISLQTKEMILNEKVIIPIWYNITREEIAKHDLALADKFAISIGNDFNIDDLAVKIIKIIRPDTYQNINRMRQFENMRSNSMDCTIDLEDLLKIPAPPIRHENLSIQMKARLKLIHNTIEDVDKRNYNDYEEDFRRSINIDREMIITELITAAYIECINKRKMKIEEKREIYLLTISLGKPLIDLNIDQNELKEFKEIIENYTKNIDAIPIVEYIFNTPEDN
jgi:hypothetical protein